MDKHTEDGACAKLSAPLVPRRTRTIDGKTVDVSVTHLCLRRQADDATVPFCVMVSVGKSCCGDSSPSGERSSAVVKLKKGQGRPADQVLVLHAATQENSPPQGDRPGLLLRQTPRNCASRTLPLSVLKSALQKCVRRNRAVPAVRVAIALMRKTSIVELLRRLCVIVIEDAALCPQFPALVWFLASYSRGYSNAAEPRTADILFILETVALIALVPVKDAAAGGANEEAPLRSDQEEDVFAALAGMELPDPLRSMVFTLGVRASYGGMPCDVRMFQNAARCWLRRFTEDPVGWQRKITAAYDSARQQLPPNFESVICAALGPSGHLLRGDIPLASIDFHCSPICDELVSIAYSNAQSLLRTRLDTNRDEMLLCIKELMWTHRSSVTDKVMSWMDSSELQSSSEAEGGAPTSGQVGQFRDVWTTELEGPAHVWARSFLKRHGL
jgi:hypothetical protein